MQQAIKTATQWLNKATRVTVLTGAGISAESGVPTFRGDQGLWKQYRAEDLANPSAFAKDPALVWRWYDWRRQLISETKPNAGHFALAELTRHKPPLALITQNVDGLHDLAGSQGILKLHGDIWGVRCTECDYRGVNRDVPLPQLPPRCDCGSLLRPDIVWFGEALDEMVLQQAWRQSTECDLMLVIGTSGLVQPAASLPLAAANAGAKIIEINPESTPLSEYCQLSIQAPSGEALPAIVQSIASAPGTTT